MENTKKKGRSSSRTNQPKTMVELQSLVDFLIKNKIASYKDKDFEIIFTNQAFMTPPVTKPIPTDKKVERPIQRDEKHTQDKKDYLEEYDEKTLFRSST